MSDNKDGASLPSRSDSIKYTADTSELGDEDTFDVISALTPLASKWRPVEIGLGLNSSRIDNIKALCRGKPKENIREVVSDFLKKRYNTEKFGEPSWQSVVRVVAHPAAGDDRELAAKIARDHPAQVEEKQQSSNGVYSRGAPTDLLPYNWFHGNMTRVEAEKLLGKAKRSCFLVRVESDSLIISSKVEKVVWHFTIERPPGSYFVALSTLKFLTVAELIKYYEKNSISDVVKHLLTTPLSKDAEHSVTSEPSAYSVGVPNHLLPFDWYHGKVSKNGAERALAAAGILCFMVRESADNDSCLVLSVKHPQGISHFNVDRGPGWYRLQRSTVKFTSVAELVSHYQDVANVETPNQYLTEPCPRGNHLDTYSGVSQGLLPAVYETIGPAEAVTGLGPSYATVSDHVSSRWKRCASMPHSMSTSHVVKLGKSIYVGGGMSHIADSSFFVLKYDLAIDRWSVLPKCPNRDFGLAELNGRLIAIGGDSCSYSIGPSSCQVFSFYDDSKTWKKDLPPLQTNRSYPSVVSYESCIITFGGVTVWGKSTSTTSETNTVEIFNKTDGKWRYTCPLPFEDRALTSCVFQDNCFVGNRYSNRLLFMSLSSLIHESHTDHPVCKWVDVDCGLPLYGSTLCVAQSAILCIGGVRDMTASSNISSSFIYKFDLLRKRWSKHAVQLPERRCNVGAIELDNGEILVLGGEENDTLVRATVFRGLL